VAVDGFNHRNLRAEQPLPLGALVRRHPLLVALASICAVFAVAKLAPHARADAAKECVLSDDALRGKQWAPTCKSCHDIDARRPLSPIGGPNLHDIYLSQAGTQSLKYGYNYHKPLVAARDAGLIWTDANLDGYLKSPESFLNRVTGQHFDHRLYMNFFIGGQESSQVQARRDVIAYLRAIKGKPCN
jgi:cytochrome c2